jgi:hypothetical protein
MFGATRRLILLSIGCGVSIGAGPADRAHAQDPSASAPPKIDVLTSSGPHARGLIFVAPKTTSEVENPKVGPLIIDDQGRPIWFRAVPAGESATDFRVQHYRGEPVLTWWQGTTSAGPGRGQGVDYILDRNYQTVATVKAGNGLDADLHEFRITPEGTALITIYHDVPYDLSPVGGSASGLVVDGIVQEIEIASGKVLFEWHSLDHVGLDESQAPPPAADDTTTAYDYFHVNQAHLDPQGNVVIDARNTWTVYTVDRNSGEVRARLGGKHSDVTLGTDVEFAWQHDPENVGDDTFRIFDNEAAPQVREHSRVIWVQVKDGAATLLRSFEHPDGLLAQSQGNAQALERGHTFVGWGATGRFSEFDPNGELVFDANVPANYDNYRAYRSPWHARPSSPPLAQLQANPDGTRSVHAVWNGATDVARWTVVAGSDPEQPSAIAQAAWNGLDTAIEFSGAPTQIAVVAEDEWGRTLGRSQPIAVGN